MELQGKGQGGNRLEAKGKGQDQRRPRRQVPGLGEQTVPEDSRCWPPAPLRSARPLRSRRFQSSGAWVRACSGPAKTELLHTVQVTESCHWSCIITKAFAGKLCFSASSYRSLSETHRSRKKALFFSRPHDPAPAITTSLLHGPSALFPHPQMISKQEPKNKPEN